MIHYFTLFQHASKNRAFQDPKASTTAFKSRKRENRGKTWPQLGLKAAAVASATWGNNARV